ncbi:hypothetical protein FAM21838_02030 [Lentilactobacillus parabuchneri]|uniref:hypothetical protein n=1 Tax=Lentilactobacillus parabuchneri TaxID=152331 RepID=UPI000A11243F|nr:hypothetical protein [Lentilactobacillus parabuchneri]ORN08347.1 hypothetical protein FAM21838_02030 [Lentilactobacillus parabuchneri]
MENSEKKLEALMGNEIHKTVEWKDDKDKKHTTKITLQDPGIGVATQIMDLMNVGGDSSDYGTAFEMLMQNVLVSPHLDYGSLNHELPEKLTKKTVIKQNSNGDDVKINMVFPDYRTALQIFMMTNRPSGALNMHDTLVSLNKEVLRTDEKTPQIVKMKYWNVGEHGSGLGATALSEAQSYLGSLLARNGLLNILMESFRFLATTLRPK